MRRAASAPPAIGEAEAAAASVQPDAQPSPKSEEARAPRGLQALRPDQAARLECLRIAVTPQLMRDAGMAIKFATQLEAYVMHGAPPQEAGGQA